LKLGEYCEKIGDDEVRKGNPAKQGLKPSAITVVLHVSLSEKEIQQNKD